MIYQHATSERYMQIADALNLMIEAARESGEHGARPDINDDGQAA